MEPLVKHRTVHLADGSTMDLTSVRPGEWMVSTKHLDAIVADARADEAARWAVLVNNTEARAAAAARRAEHALAAMQLNESDNRQRTHSIQQAEQRLRDRIARLRKRAYTIRYHVRDAFSMLAAGHPAEVEVSLRHALRWIEEQIASINKVDEE